MKIFLSALNPPEVKKMKTQNAELLWNLLSFYQIQKDGLQVFQDVLSMSREMMIDSGAHSFQKGKKVDWDEYTSQYIDFIRRYDCKKILGYFEMDVDNIIGYDKVLQLRRRLLDVTDKVIPVWHKNRGVEDFKHMCQEYSGRIVAISGFSGQDIRDNQYAMFVNYAHRCGCKIHGLGLTRKKILDAVGFDFCDSASWILSTSYGKVIGHKDRRVGRNLKSIVEVRIHNYLQYQQMQREYYMKWKRIHND